MKQLLQSLHTHAVQQPRAVALSSAGKRIDYAQLWNDIEQTARQLRDAKVRSLGVYLDNGIEWIVLDLAAAQAGVRVVPLPWFFSDTQLRHAIERGAVDHIACDDELPAGIGGSGCSGFSYRASRVLALNGAETERSDDSWMAAKLSFTSGSTGQPKGIDIDAGLIEHTIQALNEAIPSGHLETHLSILPYATLLENIAGVYLPLMLGKTVYAEPAATIGLTAELGIEPQTLAQTFARVQPNSLILTPQLLELLCVLAERGAIDPRCLKFVAVGGAHVAAALLQRAWDLGIPAYEGYGLTEFGSVAILNTPEHQRFGAAGKPLPGVMVTLAEDNEICLSTEITSTVDGVETMRVHKVATGDYGAIDTDGFVRIHGRKSNLIVLSSGRNVAPEWVESELNSSPLIVQSFVYSADGNDLSLLLFSSELADAEISAEIERINHGLPAYARIHRWQRLAKPFSRDNRMLTVNGRLRRAQITEALPTLTGQGSQPIHLTEGGFSPNLNPGVNSMSNQSFFNQIETTAADARAQLESIPVIARTLGGDVEMETYKAFLVEAYHHVKHTVPLLMACGSRLPERLEWLREALVTYIEEEVGHQEWILNDLASLGVDKEQVRHGKPDPATEIMVAYAYDTVMRNNPVGLFGMVYALEKTSSTIATFAAGQIADGLKLSRESMSYMLSHGSLDVEHMQHFEKLMNRLDDEDDKAAVLHAAPMFYQLYGNVFKSLPLSDNAEWEQSHAA